MKDVCEKMEEILLMHVKNATSCYMHFFIYTVGSGEVIRQAFKMPKTFAHKKRACGSFDAPW
jgi:hypothetical protein